MDQELSNKKLMQSVISALKEGNIEPLFAAVSPDIFWKSNAPLEFFRSGRGLIRPSSVKHWAKKKARLKQAALFKFIEIE
jgi:hypothetical protein